MLDVVVHNIHLWFNLSKKGGQLLQPSLYWLMRILDVLELGEVFPMQFRPSWISWPMVIEYKNKDKIDLLWAQRKVFGDFVATLWGKNIQPVMMNPWLVTYWALGRRRKSYEMQRSVTRFTYICLLMFWQNAWGLSWVDQGCQSLSSKETGRGWVVVLVRWVPTLHEMGEVMASGWRR